MLIRHAKMFNLGALLGISFLVVLFLIFQPIFPGGKTGLDFSDDLFNKLSKGSSYFIPEVEKDNEKFIGTDFSVSIKLDKAEQVDKAVEILTTGGAQAVAQDTQVTISGDLGKLLGNVIKDSDEMYKNDGTRVSEAHGFNEMDVMALWWSILSKMNREFQKNKKVNESDMVMKVMQKAIEPAYNYYGIEAEKISGKAFTLAGLLIFYVLYTMWWGYAIFDMFDGIGLSMKKAKVKKEV
jgi:hypothetical protein